jgi:hypothetical protein
MPREVRRDLGSGFQRGSESVVWVAEGEEVVASGLVLLTTMMNKIG